MFFVPFYTPCGFYGCMFGPDWLIELRRAMGSLLRHVDMDEWQCLMTFNPKFLFLLFRHRADLLTSTYMIKLGVVELRNSHILADDQHRTNQIRSEVTFHFWTLYLHVVIRYVCFPS